MAQYITEQVKSNRVAGYPYFFLILIGVWIVINVLQATYTAIGGDEAYYWVYAQHLDWGYYDHPPMVAVLIWLGTHLLGGELGVRIGFIALQGFTLCVIWMMERREASRRGVATFFCIAAAMPLFQVYGFMATPDGPLLCFTAIFLSAYTRWIARGYHVVGTLAIALAMAGLGYSKYQGVLVVGFVLLSNLSLLKNKQWWIAAGIALLLYLPHLYWQWAHDFPSIRYHLIARVKPATIYDILDYLPNQLLCFSPVVFCIAIYCMVCIRSRDVLERGLYMVIGGMLVFFGLSTVRGHVEPQWTVAAAIPMIIVVYRAAMERERIGQWVRGVCAVMIAATIVARVAIVFPILPLPLEFVTQRAWVNRVHEVARARPVVFTNSYQMAAVYQYYIGSTSYSYNSIQYRQNQYDLWQWEDSLYGRDVVIVAGDQDPTVNGFTRYDGKQYYIHEMKQYQGVRGIQTHIIAYTPQLWHSGDTVTVTVDIVNPYSHPIYWNITNYLVECRWAMYNAHRMEIGAVQMDSPIYSMNPGQQCRRIVQFIVPAIQEGSYQGLVSLRSGILPEGFNGVGIPIVVKK